MCQALREIMRPEIEAEVKAGEARAENRIVSLIHRLRAGETMEALAAEGYDPNTLQLAASCL